MLFLESLDNKLGDDGVKALSEALMTNTTLTSLDIGSLKSRDEPHNTSITRIIASENDFLLDGIQALSRMLKTNTTLKRLSLGSFLTMDFPQDGTHRNKTSFAYPFTGNNIGDEGATTLSDQLKINTSLARLDVNSLVLINKHLMRHLRNSFYHPRL